MIISIKKSLIIFLKKLVEFLRIPPEPFCNYRDPDRRIGWDDPDPSELGQSEEK